MISRKLISAVCLLALGGSYLTALGVPLLAAVTADCCTDAVCPLHRPMRDVPATPDCHKSGKGLGESALESCHQPAPQAITAHVFLLTAPVELSAQPTLTAELISAEPFFPAPDREIASPPPRIALS